MQKELPVTGAHRLLGHTSIYAFGTILRQLVGFIMLPIYTRFLTPADYGVVGLMTFALSLAELVFGARLSYAIPKYYFDTKDKQKRAEIVSTAMIISGIVSGIATAVVILLRRPVSQGIYGTPEYATIVGLFSVQLLTQALEPNALLYLRLQQRPWFYVIVNFTKLLIQLSLNILFVVYLKMSAIGVAASAMVSSCVFAILLLTYTFRQVGWSFKPDMARKMIRFCWPLWLSGFAGLYIGSANRYYLRIFTSLDDIGLFELAVKFSTIISMMVWSPFSTYWQVERFNYYERGNADTIFQNIFYLISTLLILVALGISIFAGSIIRVMAEPAFHKASQAVPYLCFSAVFDCLILYVNFPFLVKEKTGWISRNNYITAIIVTFLYLSLIPTIGHIGAALALMLAKGIQFLIVHHASQRFYDMGISMKPLMGMLLTSAFACFMADWALGEENQLETLALKCILYIAACIIIVMPLWRKKEIRRYLYKLAPRVLLKQAN